MKRIFFIMISLITFSACVAQELKQIKTYENKMEEGYLQYRTKLEAYDDGTGNHLYFDENGDMYIFQFDSAKLYRTDKNLDVAEVQDYKMHFLYSIDKMYPNTLGVTDNVYGYMLYDRNTREKKADIKGMSFEIHYKYYDEENDVLFLTDENKNIYSVINPSLDNEKNKKNFRNAEQTEQIFSKESEYGRKGLYVDGEKIFINGENYYWKTPLINKYQYFINWYSISVLNTLTGSEIFEVKLYDEKEKYESAAVHPCGDIYILRFNEKQNMHTLYRIENTWDSAWRKQWYKEHK